MRVLTYKESAERLGICLRTLMRLIADGEGPAIVELGSHRKGILESDLVLWIDSRRRPAPTKKAAKAA